MTPDARPVIAIDGELTSDSARAALLPTRYADVVFAAGGLPLVLAAISSPEYIQTLLDSVDGVLFAGGDDFDTETLGLGPTHSAAKPVPAEKQAFDVALARACIARRVPTLGICYGMQLLALSEGGTLHQHLPEDRPGGRDHKGGVQHVVRVNPDSKLGAICRVPEFSVISRHHQALSDAGPAWLVSGVDDEDLIESIEREDHPFAVGVQWHPELEVPAADCAASGLARTRLFAAFIEAAASSPHRAERSGNAPTPELTAS